MRREIIISKTCQLEIESEPESTFLGWKYAIGDGGSGGASTFATLDNDSEFNRLALQSPLVRRMMEFIKDNPPLGDDGNRTLIEWQQLLAEIEKLEAK